MRWIEDWDETERSMVIPKEERNVEERKEVEL